MIEQDKVLNIIKMVRDVFNIHVSDKFAKEFLASNMQLRDYLIFKKYGISEMNNES